MAVSTANHSWTGRPTTPLPGEPAGASSTVSLPNSLLLPPGGFLPLRIPTSEDSCANVVCPPLSNRSQPVWNRTIPSSVKWGQHALPSLQDCWGTWLYQFECLCGLQLPQLAGRITTGAEILGADTEILHLPWGKKQCFWPKPEGAQCFQNKRREEPINHPSSPQEEPLRTPTKHRSVNFACVFLIALLISRQTKIRGSFVFSLCIFSSFIFCILTAP